MTTTTIQVTDEELFLLTNYQEISEDLQALVRSVLIALVESYYAKKRLEMAEAELGIAS